MAPISAWMIRRFGPQLTLLSGATIMCIAYVGRVFLSDTLTHVVIGSVLVGTGTAMTFGAMPTLVMRAVPVTETASANGLNVLLRSIGTSTASAATAALATASAVRIAGRDVPTFDALATVFWIAATASLGAMLLSIPMLRMKEYAEGPDYPDAAASGRRTQVVHGHVVTPSGRPITNAVVTVLTPEGDPIDWGQADSEGRFTAAIPEVADYLVVTTADGWQPRSRVMTLDDNHALPPITLRDRLTLSGTVTDANGQPLSDALVVLTRQSGESVDTTRSDHDGRYQIPRPTNGRYVLTVFARDGSIGARPVTVLDAARDLNLALGTPLA